MNPYIQPCCSCHTAKNHCVLENFTVTKAPAKSGRPHVTTVATMLGQNCQPVQDDCIQFRVYTKRYTGTVWQYYYAVLI